MIEETLQREAGLSSNKLGGRVLQYSVDMNFCQCCFLSDPHINNLFKRLSLNSAKEQSQGRILRILMLIMYVMKNV